MPNQPDKFTGENDEAEAIMKLMEPSIATQPASEVVEIPEGSEWVEEIVGIATGELYEDDAPQRS